VRAVPPPPADLPAASTPTDLDSLPDGWDVVRVRDIAYRLKAGGTPNRSVLAYWGGEIPFVKIEDMTRSGGDIRTTAECITPEGLQNSSAWIVPENTVLLAMYASIGEVAINRIPVATNQAIIAILPNRKLSDTEFLYFCLKYFGKSLVSYNVQTTQKNINKGIVEQFSIPCPPLPEQRAIARVLRTVQRAAAAADAVIAAARAL
jgi:type I restriction enzyme S subunit